MEIIVKGRNADVSDRFRRHVEDKLQKVEQFAPRAQRVDVEVTHEPNPAQAETSERIEITVIDKGPVIRAESAASDRYGALDLALGKLLERLRRARDRRKDHHRTAQVATPLNLTPEDVNVPKEKDEEVKKEDAAPRIPTAPGQEVENQLGDSPVIVRQKLYEATPMSIDQALYEMEMVGHPFYLFIDEETKQPCAVYHRRGWTYGVIRLDATTS
ncbi:MAG: ribosome-associated translation inhibitor RaiA [Actinomycetaceae bacterium]|nr:ribosome-associated translation inhibitor RaiA [Actinomycetaceae bacterium]